MMTKPLFYLALLLFFSCNDDKGVKRSEALPYFEKVNNAFVSAADTKLIYEMIDASLLIKQNKRIDSIKLTRSLDTATYIIGENIKMVQSLKELDEKINLRRLTLDCLYLRDSAYKNEFRLFLQTANVLDDKREERAQNLILSILDRLRIAENKVVAAELKFRTAHGLR